MGPRRLALASQRPPEVGRLGKGSGRLPEAPNKGPSWTEVGAMLEKRCFFSIFLSYVLGPIFDAQKARFLKAFWLDFHAYFVSCRPLKKCTKHSK